jgi:hypothetical protein
METKLLIVRCCYYYCEPSSQKFWGSEGSSNRSVVYTEIFRRLDLRQAHFSLWSLTHFGSLVSWVRNRSGGIKNFPNWAMAISVSIKAQSRVRWGSWHYGATDTSNKMSWFISRRKSSHFRAIISLYMRWQRKITSQWRQSWRRNFN